MEGGKNISKDDLKYNEPKSEDAQGDNGKIDKIKRKRRSKNEQDGRNFKCTTCGKAYLSMPALTNHIKTKHLQDDPNYVKRNRGRPRKNPIVSSQLEKDYERFSNFYNKETRHRGEGEVFSYEDIVRYVFEYMQNTFQNKLFTKTNNIREHPLYKIMMDMTNSPVQEIGKIPADEAFAKYTKDFYPVTNKQYFIFIVKFVILFRECFNQYRKLENNKEQEYSEIQGADIIPELCNEFITEFLDANDNYGMDLNEAIELIQHFCNWLYEKKYTVSRLTLLTS